MKTITILLASLFFISCSDSNTNGGTTNEVPMTNEMRSGIENITSLENAIDQKIWSNAQSANDRQGRILEALENCQVNYNGEFIEINGADCPIDYQTRSVYDGENGNDDIAFASHTEEFSTLVGVRSFSEKSTTQVSGDASNSTVSEEAKAQYILLDGSSLSYDSKGVTTFREPNFNSNAEMKVVLNTQPADALTIRINLVGTASNDQINITQANCWVNGMAISCDRLDLVESSAMVLKAKNAR